MASAHRSAPTAVAAGQGLVTCRPALAAAELAAHYAIRRQVFVTEQDVFTGSDRDAHDQGRAVMHLLGRYGDVPAGAVRLFPVDETGRLWQGDRLCVLAPFRTRGLGAPLVRCAVASAGARGGTWMMAHIQLANVRFFTHLGWRAEGGTEIYAGLRHQPMAIELPSPSDGARIEREFFAGVSAVGQ